MRFLRMSETVPFQQEPNNCLVCKKGEVFSFIQNYRDERGAFSLYECGECKARFWVPLKNLGAQWYEQRSGYSTANLVKPVISRGYHKKFFALHPSLTRKSLLDVGCGSGEFLAKAEKKGAAVWGFDFDGVAILAAKKHFGLSRVYAMTLEEFAQKVNPPKFDIITCFEVIEHVDDPGQLIERLIGLLKPEGKIVLSTPSRERLVPNSNMWDFPPNHLTRWNKEALTNVFGSFGFEMSSLYYVEGFRFLLEAINGKLRFGIVKKVQKGLRNNETASSFFTRSVSVLAVLKEYLFGFMPAFLLWIWSFFAGSKNGSMLAEFQRKESAHGKKKLLFFIPTLAQGGGERVVSELSLHTPETIERKIVLFENKVAYPYKGELINLEVPISLNFFLRGLYFFIRLFKFRKILAKERPDFVVSFGAGANMINLLLNSQKAIVRVDNFFSKNNAGFWRGVYSIFIKLFFNRAQRIIVVSHVAAEDLVKNFNVRREKIKVIYNPVDVQKIQKLSREPLGAQYREVFRNLVVITMGRFTKQKGQWHLIEAFKKFKEIVPGAQLVILGEGELRESFQKLAKNSGMADCVHFLGWQKNPFPFLRASKLFVLPSLWEGLPTVLLEAMACGLPVISADCKSGPREILAPKTDINKTATEVEIGEYGMLVPPEDEKALIDAMARLCKDVSLCLALKGKSAQRAQDFDAQKLIKDWAFLW